jgi:hypothetical protein
MSVEYKTNGIVVNVSLSRCASWTERDFSYNSYAYSYKYLNVVLDNDGNVISVS